jgi:hypothetical protein
VYVNPGTQNNVKIPVKITILKSGQSTNITAFNPLACGYGYEKGEKALSKYGFDLLSWDWSFNDEMDCSTHFCDTTQLMIYSLNKVERLNAFIQANRAKGVFTGKDTFYSTSDFIEKIVKTVKIKNHDFSNGTDEEIPFYLSTDKQILPSQDEGNQAAIGNLLELELADNPSESEYLSYLIEMESAFDSIEDQFSLEYRHMVVLMDQERLQNGLPKDAERDASEIAAALHAELLPGSPYYVWTLSEYHQIHSKLLNYIQTDTASLAIPGGPLLTAKDAKKIIFSDGTASAYIHYYELSAIRNAVSSLRVGFGVDPEVDSTLDEDTRKYLLAHAAKEGSFTWGEYGSSSKGAQAFIDDVLDDRVLLLKDTIPDTFIEDFVSVEGEPYHYTSRLKDMGISLDFVKEDIVFDKEDGIDAAPGQYTLSLDGGWDNTGAALDTLTIFITKKDVKTLAGLQPEGAKYEDNPFFHIAFNGSVAKDERKAKKYSSPYHIDPTSQRVIGGKGLSVENTTIEQIAAFSQENENLPVLFKISSAYEGGYSLETAPHVPVPLKLRFGGATSNPAYQYAVVPRGKELVPNPPPLNVVTWYDCTDAFSPPVKDPTLVATAAVCGDLDTASHSLQQESPGEYFYSGMLLLPPSTSTSRYDFYPVCARDQGELRTLKGAVSINTASGTQSPLQLDETYAGPAARDIPDSLNKLIEYVRDGKACAKVDGGFTVIWELGNQNIVPVNLTCKSK